ncbi:MAG TPA: Sir2 family NAD-dependent protein deacetylase, partial [Acidimicrobiales bacterium]|nr:Sir2 family NAD-dependent protein deacetylase [Acidimicrobiales bacterium]
QNIDGLHLEAGSSPELVVELHGTMHQSLCWSCGDRRPMPETLDRVRAGEEDPACLVCGGILKSATISFGQSLDPKVLDRAEAAARGCDLLLAVGSTLNVFPVAGLVPVAKRSGAAVVIVNADATGFDHLADVIVRASISDVLPALVAG